MLQLKMVVVCRKVSLFFFFPLLKLASAATPCSVSSDSLRDVLEEDTLHPLIQIFERLIVKYNEPTRSSKL